ncbi:MAG TPA: lipoyl(octanoyl) transferase LipB [Moheibacter sp.]|nr:lipoyl(octanoyl) transferase LipB [Moheibacter sp.]
MQNKQVQFKDWGIAQDYEEIWAEQEKLLADNLAIKSANRAKEKAGDPKLEMTHNHLFFVEHPHVYTLGRSGHLENLLASQAFLDQIEATFVKTNRGGDITYHGPEQLVGYPVLDLENFKSDIHWYMRNLEEIIIRTLADFGLASERSKGETGVWLDVGKSSARKICAMGVKASRWVTIHGFALNVNPDMRYFDYIVPCGIQDKAVTSMEIELGEKVSMDRVKKSVLKHFEAVFEAEMIF